VYFERIVNGDDMVKVQNRTGAADNALSLRDRREFAIDNGELTIDNDGIGFADGILMWGCGLPRRSFVAPRNDTEGRNLAAATEERMSLRGVRTLVVAIRFSPDRL